MIMTDEELRAYNNGQVERLATLLQGDIQTKHTHLLRRRLDDHDRNFTLVLVLVAAQLVLNLGMIAYIGYLHTLVAGVVR
jgi:hypothetical protein